MLGRKSNGAGSLCPADQKSFSVAEIVSRTLAIRMLQASAMEISKECDPTCLGYRATLLFHFAASPKDRP
jgi:hypothetical protein